MLARYAAAFTASAIIMVGVYDMIGAAGAGFIYGQLAPSAALIVAMSLLFTAAMVAFVVLFSSIFRSPNISIIVVIVFVWILMPLISSVLNVVSVEPWFLLTYAGNVLQALAQKTYPPNVQTVQISPAGGLPSVTVYNPTVLEATGIMIGYLIISLLLAWFVYSRRELKETA
jgi:ABC-type transport system involved in multi-copper enzyme maturation permease subunit